MFQIIFAILLAILPACPTEDSGTFCSWDASERGNGIGTDYIVLESILIRADGSTLDLD